MSCPSSLTVPLLLLFFLTIQLDPSPHSVRFVTAATDVNLEVLVC